MLSLQELSHRVIIAENLYISLQNIKRSFMVMDDPETIKLIIKVLQGANFHSFVRLSDHQIYVIF